MFNIATLTFSPCIDKSTTVGKLLPDKKLYCSDPVFEPGGGGINVARAIKKLGGEALAIYPAGGRSGTTFTSLLNKEHVASIIIETRMDTRENIIVYDEASRQQYRFGMPANELLKEEWFSMLQAVEGLGNI